MRRLVIYIAVIMLLLMTVRTAYQARQLERLTAERDRYLRNTETLLSDCRSYRVRDSLSAVRVGSLELTVKELEAYRAADAAIIRDLTSRARDLAAVNRLQAQTILSLSAPVHDTVILLDTVRVPARAVHCGDAWYDFDGIMTETTFAGTLVNRDSLLITESVRYRKFLFWRTRRVRDRQLDAVSLNPHTTLMGIEYIIIER